MVSVHLL
jgi:hypothetical protein